MRTRNEKILLGVLVFIIFAFANFYGYKWLTQKQAALENSYRELRADQAEARVDLQKQDTWTQRQGWIKDHQPVLGEEGDAKAQVLESIIKGAREQHLEVLEQNLNEVTHNSAGAQVNVTIKIKGSMEGLVRWLHDLENPENFYAVSSFSLKADQDQKSMICSLQLARYFK